MPPLTPTPTPPGGVKVVVMNSNNASRGDSFSSTSSLLDELKNPRYSQNASNSFWNSESALPENGGRASGTTTATEEDSTDREAEYEQIRVSKKASSEEDEDPVKVKRTPQGMRAQSLSGNSSQATPPYNPYSQHSYSPHRTPVGMISNVSIWMEARRRNNLQTPSRSINGASIQSSEESVDSDEELEQMSLKIRSEIRQMEMMELAVAAEKAAEAGEEFFVGVPSTFGDGAGSDPYTFLLSPPGLKLKRHRTEGSLKRPSLLARTRSLQPVTKLKVVALRDVSEVIPRLDELHTHLRSHLAQRGVDQQTLVLNQLPDSPTSKDSDTPSVADSVGQSITFLRRLKLWGSHKQPETDSSIHNASGNTMNLWGSPTPARSALAAKRSFLTPRRRTGSGMLVEDHEFSPNSLIDVGQTSNHDSVEDQTGGSARALNSMSSFDSIPVGKVLAQHIATGPPRTRGPIRVPSGLALPNIGATLSEKDELNYEIKTTFHDSTKSERGFREAVESGTISTAFSTSSSFGAGTDTKQTPPDSLLDATEVDVKSALIHGKGDETSQINIDHNDIFTTPTRLRNIRDGHQRCYSNDQMPGNGVEQLSVNAIGFVKGDALHTQLSTEEHASSGNPSVPVKGSAVSDLLSTDYATLSMRPLNNGLTELGGLEFGDTADREKSPEITSRPSNAILSASPAAIPKNLVHGVTSLDSDSIETSHACVGPMNLAHGLVTPAATGLDSLSHAESTDELIHECQDAKIDPAQSQDIKMNTFLLSEPGGELSPSGGCSVSDSIDDAKPTIENRARYCSTNDEQSDEPAKPLQKENADTPQSQACHKELQNTTSAIGGMSVERIELNIDRGTEPAEYQDGPSLAQPQKRREKDDSIADEDTVSSCDAENTGTKKSTISNEGSTSQLPRIEANNSAGVESSPGECKNTGLTAIAQKERRNDHKNFSLNRDGPPSNSPRNAEEKSKAFSVDEKSDEYNSELSGGSQLEPINGVIDAPRAMLRASNEKPLKSLGKECDTLNSVDIKGTRNEVFGSTSKEPYNEAIYDQNVNQSRDDSPFEELDERSADAGALAVEGMAMKCNSGNSILHVDPLSDVVKDNQTDQSQPSGIPSSEVVYSKQQSGKTVTSYYGKGEATDCLLTPAFPTCECFISPVSTTESMSSNLDSDAGEPHKELTGNMRRVISMPSLTDALDTSGKTKSPGRRFYPKRRFAAGKSEPGISTFSSRFEALAMKQRLAGGQSEPGASSFASRFDTAAKNMLRRLSSRDFDCRIKSPKHAHGLFIPANDNNAFLNNYLYCSKPPETKDVEPPKQPAASLCETGSGPCVEFVGCGGFMGAVDAAMEILPSRTSDKEIFSLNNGSTHSTEETDNRWFDGALERFDDAFERLVGRVHEHGSRWDMKDFRAPSLMVKKTVPPNKPRAPQNGAQHSSDEQLQLMYGMTREQFVSLPRSERMKLKEQRSLTMSNFNYRTSTNFGRTDGHRTAPPPKARDDKELSASGVLGMTLLTNSYSG